jgi:hypothetical protein
MAGQQLPQPGGDQRSQTKFIVFENFEKMNTQSIRQSLSEKELAWLENLQPIAGNNLTTVPGPSAVALATLGETISEMFYADLMGVDYFVVFTFSGSGYLVNISTGAVNNFAPDGTFSPYPDVTTWEATRLLIADPLAGFTSFDGQTFSQQGGVSPNITVTNGGSGYGSVPTVTISGGSGSGAAAIAVLTNGVVTSITLINPGHGYQPTDVLTVTISGSVGSGATGHVTMTNSSVGSLSLTSQGLWNGNPAPAAAVALAFSGGGGTGAAGYCTVFATGSPPTQRRLSAAVLTTPGYGYTSAPTVTIPGLSGVIQQPIITAVLGTESVATIVLDTAGAGYAGPPAVSIVPSDGNGSGATAVTTLAGTSVNTLTLDPSPVLTLQIAIQGVSSTPGTYALSFTGGGGTLAAGTATIGNYLNNGGGISVGVISYNLTNGGTGYTTAPAVTVVGATFSINPTINAFIASQGAGYDLTPAVLIGAGIGATATAHVWPFINSSIVGYAFTTVAVFQGRVWLGGGPLLTWSGTGASFGNVGYDDFLAADASGSLIISDADLIHAITALRSLNNYLWIMGDQSVKQIGNISLNSAGNVTLFTILTLSSDQGTIYKKSCISYNRVFMFANTNGIYGVFGSSVQKLSSDMDGIWKQVDFTLQPQGALADINAIHNAVFLVSYVDSLIPFIPSFQADNSWTVVAFVTLSNANHTATLVASNTGQALSVNSYTKGLIYAEFAVTSDFTAAGSSIGVISVIAGTGASISAAGGEISTSAGPVGPIGNFNGKILRIALDATNALIWFSISGGPWNGNPAANPATGAGGINFPTSSGLGPNANHDALFFNTTIAGQTITDTPAITINTAGPLIFPNPFLSVTGRSIMLAFDGKKWFVINQGMSLAAIATSANLASGQNSLYGSLTGLDITKLLAATAPPTNSFGPFGGTWNPAIFPTNTAYSNGNLTITRIAGPPSGSITTVYHTAGLYYLEFTPNANFSAPINITNGNGDGIGVLNLTTGLNAIVIGGDGEIWVFNAVAIDTGINLGSLASSVVDVAFDATNALVWFRVNNGLWNGNPTADPTTGVGGINFWTSTHGPGPNTNGDHLFWFAAMSSVNASVTINPSLALSATLLPFKIQTALTHHGNAVQGKKAIRAGLSSDLANGTGAVVMTVDTEVVTSGTAHVMDVPNGFAVIGGANDANNLPINTAGIYLGLTITGALSDFTMTNLLLEYQETSLWKGK